MFLLPPALAKPLDLQVFGTYGCTALAVGKDATTDSSTMISHGDDCPTCDFRLAYVPAKTHKSTDTLPVYIDHGDYPRMVAAETAAIYAPSVYDSPSAPADVPMGTIPQVPATYGYVDGTYGIQNLHQLSIGESTCDARLAMTPKPVQHGGNALFGVTQLSRIALQRCKTAVCAIQTMGDLATEHGYYGGNAPDWAPNAVTGAISMNESEGGEALTIADKNEVWIFHISPDDTGASAGERAHAVCERHTV